MFFSPDFYAGYLSGAAGILIGNPLDIMKVRLQAGEHPMQSLGAMEISPTRQIYKTVGSWIRGLWNYSIVPAVLLWIHIPQSPEPQLLKRTS